MITSVVVRALEFLDPPAPQKLGLPTPLRSSIACVCWNPDKIKVSPERIETRWRKFLRFFCGSWIADLLSGDVNVVSFTRSDKSMEN